MNESILVVEDDAGIARFLNLQLSHDGYKVTSIADGAEALSVALERDFDLIILDIMLPTMNGIELLSRLRQSKTTPVIFLTARDQTVDKVAVLNLGANDYMVKPFVMEELLARIRVNLKKPISGGTLLSLGRLKADSDLRSVTVDNKAVELTKKEFDLLIYLLKNRNIVLTREKIVDDVWGFEYYGNTNLVDVYIRYLRAKIEDVFGFKFIRTVRGSGYTVNLDE